MTTGKTIALTRRTFVAKMMSLLFNMLSRLVIAFLPRSKHLLIALLQSWSAEIYTGITLFESINAPTRLSKVKVVRSCLTLCNPRDYTVCGILQARILEWVAIPFSRDLHNPGIEPGSPALQSDYYSKEPSN